MSGRLRVVVATTDGPSVVRRITAEDPALRSVICLAGTATALEVSRDYDAFVRRPTGVIERDVGHPVFRADVDRPIDAGRSWELGLYLAHRLKAAGRLAEDDQPADGVVWASGTVDADLNVGAIDRLADKARRSGALFDGDTPVLVVLPAANAAEGAPGPMGATDLLAITRVEEALSHLHLIDPVPPAGPGWGGRWVRGGILAATLAAGIVWLSRPTPGPIDPEPLSQAGVAASATSETVAADAAPFDPSDVAFDVLEARAEASGCGPGSVVDPAVASEPGVCAVAFRATNHGARPARMWLYAAVQGTFREYASRQRYVELADGILAPGESGEARVHPPDWVRRPVMVRGLLIIAEGERPQVDQAMILIDLLSASDIDLLIDGLRDLGLSVREIYHRVVPAR